MPANESLSDDLVANLLAKDAKASNARYSAYGLQELLPKRPTYTAPKPNTRFLKNIIKETDSHNAALRAKEAADSRAQLRKLHDEDATPEDGYGRLSREEDPPPKRRRIKKGSEARQHSLTDERHHSHRIKSTESRSYRRHREDAYDSGEERYNRSRHHRTHHHRKSHRRRSRSRSSHDSDDKRGSRRRSRSPRRSRSRSPHSRKGDHQKHRSRRRSRSRTPTPELNKHKPRPPSVSNGSSKTPHSADNDPNLRNHRPPSPSSDSDPLSSIIGPPPPPPPPTIRPRGRGAFASTSAMDTHFSSSYDPTIDVQPDPSLDDDWDMALEALRDRQKWQKQGAERLKAAGFTEEEVEKWEKGGERREEDVRWRGRGEGREWDRGKVVGEEGVETGAEWGRLKGS